jgi:hypothetical protein
LPLYRSIFAYVMVLERKLSSDSADPMKLLDPGVLALPGMALGTPLLTGFGAVAGP